MLTNVPDFQKIQCDPNLLSEKDFLRKAPKLRLMEMHAIENIVMKDSEAKA